MSGCRQQLWTGPYFGTVHIKTELTNLAKLHIHIPVSATIRVTHVCEDISSIGVFWKEEIFISLDEVSGAWNEGLSTATCDPVVKWLQH